MLNATPHGEFVMKKLMMIAASAALLTLSGVASADQALAQKNACMSCHGVDKKIVGPAFRDIGAKYAQDANAVATLVGKVKQVMFSYSPFWNKSPRTAKDCCGLPTASRQTRVFASSSERAARTYPTREPSVSRQP